MTGADWLIAGGGFATGMATGYVSRRARLCTLGAIETALIGHDWRRMKIFGLALAIAAALTQAMIFTGLLDATATPYVPARVAIPAILIGGVLFGVGMALVGTCAFGSLLRLGGGDLRSLPVLLVFAAVATATLRGGLSGLRIDGLERLALTMPGGTAGSLPALAGFFGGPWAAPLVSLGLIVALGWPGLRDRRLRTAPRLLRAALVLGIAIPAGWMLTGVLPDPLATPVRVQSLTFVAPVARGFHAIVFGSREWLEFGVMSVAGVIAGAYAGAWRNDERRWEAFDDHVEMRRHLIGAALMGFGGVLAGGCTIGQGLSAGSLFALSWPIAVLGIMAGARLGLAILLRDTWSDLLPQRLRTRRSDAD